MSTLAQVGQTVAKFAPLLGAVLPIPGAQALGNAIAKVFGGDINNPDDLIKRIQDDPDAAVKLLQIQSNERIEIQKLSNDYLRIGNEDRANAREREKSVKDDIPGFLAKVFVCGYFISHLLTILIVRYSDVSAGEFKLLDNWQTGMNSALMLVLAYYFGASFAKFQNES